MKSVKSLSIIVPALLAAQSGINPAVFAMNPNNTAKEQSKQEKFKKDEMKRRIQDHLLKIKVFHPDLENTIDTALKELNKDKDVLEIFSVEEKSIEQIIKEDNLELL